LEIWGGEQYEISFKIWMCGGEMLIVPCSHFGHMFRSEDRPSSNPRPYDYITRNYRRVIEVWMDDYKHYIYDRYPGWAVDAGPLLKQHFVREKLQCKSFKWYLENVAPEILEKYPPEGRPWFAKGAIRNVGDKSLCVDTMNEDGVIAIHPCDGNRTHPSQNQNFELSYFHEINQYGFLQTDCMDAVWPSDFPGETVTKMMCHQMQGNQFWRYDRVSLERLDDFSTM
jgi:polypeptide N-acetylgalactosaminyltransferase